MLSISATLDWRAVHPGAAIGLLELSGVDNARGSVALDDRKRQTEARLQERYRGSTRQELLSLPVMTAYVRDYRRFGKTYHVLLQLESIILKGKDLPGVSPLVDANFTAEVETLVLDAHVEQLGDSTRRLADAFARAGIEYRVIGGLGSSSMSPPGIPMPFEPPATSMSPSTVSTWEPSSKPPDRSGWPIATLRASTCRSTPAGRALAALSTWFSSVRRCALTIWNPLPASRRRYGRWKGCSSPRLPTSCG